MRTPPGKKNIKKKKYRARKVTMFLVKDVILTPESTILRFSIFKQKKFTWNLSKNVKKIPPPKKKHIENVLAPLPFYPVGVLIK